MSESHQRQLLLASENPTKFMDYFSEWVGHHDNAVASAAGGLFNGVVSLYSEFKSDFLELLRRRFGEKVTDVLRDTEVFLIGPF